MNVEKRRDLAEKAFVAGVLFASDKIPEPSPKTFESFEEWYENVYNPNAKPPSEFVGWGPGAASELNPSPKELFDLEGERTE